MDFNFDTGTIFNGIQTIDTTIAPPLGTYTDILTIIGTGAITLPQGTTVQEPSSPLAGMFRYNTDTTALEFYNNTTWVTLSSTAGSVSSFQTSLVGLTPSTATTGAVTLAGVLGVASGGTGATTLTTNGVLYGNGTNPVNITAAGVQYNILTVDGANLPVFSTLNLASSVAVGSSILGLANGGTNSANAGSNGSIIYNNGTSLVNSTVGTLGQVLTSSGAGAPTWTTASSTVTTSQIVQGDGTGAFTANNATYVGSGSASGVTLLGTVTNATDATTKAYVDSVTAGLSWKQAVQARTTVALATTYANGTAGVGATLTDSSAGTVLVLDGYTVALNDRVLVANQSSPSDNGIYTLTTVGVAGTTPYVLTRSSDNDISSEMDGAAVFTERGTVYANTSFVQTTVQPITIGTSSIDWTQFSGTGTYTAGSGLSLVGIQFNAKTDGVTTYVDGSNNIAVVSSGTTNQVLLSQGTGNTAAWGAVPLGNSNAVTGVLALVNGGTGSNLTNVPGAVVYGGATAMDYSAAGTSGYFLTSGGTGAPTWSNPATTVVTSFQTSLSGLTPSTATTGVVTLAGTLGISSGGTGQVTALAAFNALSPLTTAGDTLYYNGTNNVRLPIGTSNQVLAVIAGEPAWTSNGGLQLYAENPSTPTAPNATGTNAVAIGSGSLASAIGSYATGDGTNASIWGGKTFANGSFATAGDAQHGIYVLRNITTDNTVTELFLDGVAASQRLVLPNNSVFTFDILIAGRRTDAVGGGAGYRFVGVARKDTTSGSMTFVGTPSKTVLGETDAPWDSTISADTVNGSIKVTVTGQNAKTIRWVATVQTTEATD